MVDVVIENLFLAALDLYATEHGPLPCKMAVLATGGYGRQELNPHSDIDIMFLYPEKISGKHFAKFQEVLAEEILYPLWDLGWKVGHASRNAKEAIEEAKSEIQSKNAILESRIICGSDPLYLDMQKRFASYCKKENSKAYIQQRLADERGRHSKFGNTVYLQEPDIKNGVGGLRDYQNILWMANIKFGYGSFREINKAKLLRQHLRDEMEAAYDFLLRTRTELHLQNRRPTDKLDLEQQPTIAAGLGYPPRARSTIPASCSKNDSLSPAKMTHAARAASPSAKPCARINIYHSNASMASSYRTRCFLQSKILSSPKTPYA
jgi:[protein-PII] uridylyltransferase